MEFFLPESDDLVDPGFDFRTESYDSDRLHGILHDCYCHELLDDSPFDGILVTKSNIDPRREALIQEQGGIHKFLRLPKGTKVMGDCGAFQYIAEKSPTYTNQQIFDYYERLGFDYGITLDHVIVDFDPSYDEGVAIFPRDPSEDMLFRQKVSLDNAKQMLSLCKKKKAHFKPIGSVQGWSPKSYHEGVKSLIDAGFDYLAIGGVAKAANSVIIQILNEIRQTVINAGVKLHMLGVARLNLLSEYLITNVASCDSASTLMQAFKSTKDNYHTPQGNYTAIRIPSVNGKMSPKVRKLLKPLLERGDEAAFNKEKQRLSKLEKEALTSVRSYAKRRQGLDSTMKALIAYEDEFAGESRYFSHFERTLRDRPWENCPCAICKDIGIEVVIMRGNNRNRRRGFHNTFVFYNEFKKHRA